MSLMNSQPRFCVRCGRPEGDEVKPATKTSHGSTIFRSHQALKCVACDTITEEERKEYYRLYHQARAVAIKEMINAHKGEFEKRLASARIKIENERESNDSNGHKQAVG